ncbi:MAG TPA: phosphate ABC transporter permease [Saprospirales bacterium]|nr:phosphate ABC transporter permease [Saprospirales bacterium]HRQ28942.1 ABC transporter permease [Saprospiraceae bacterium]
MPQKQKVSDEFKPIIIRPGGSFSFGLAELWRYRELLYFFTWKEIKIRYKQALLGVLWTWLQPLTMMVVFVLVLNRGLGFTTGEVPAPLFYLSGLLIWNLFNHSVTNAAQSMVTHGHIIKKIYFPRLAIPISSIGTATFDFIISMLIFFVLLTWYQIKGMIMVSFPFLISGFVVAYLVTIFTSFSIGTWLAAINVKYRDVRYVLPFLIQSLFFITPVMYDTEKIKYGWAQKLLEINPLHYAIQLIRSGLSNGDWKSFLDLQWFMPVILICLFVFSIYIFRRMEAYFADIV